MLLMLSALRGAEVDMAVDWVWGTVSRCILDAGDSDDAEGGVESVR